MSHNIFGSRFLGRREPAWHSLGDTFDEEMTCTDAFTRVGAMYTVQAVPIVVKAFGTSFDTRRFALVREPVADDNEPRYFGEVSDQHEVMQNDVLAKMLDPISERWPVETVGALGYGETIFVTLDAGSVDVRGEEVHQYFLATDTKGGDTYGSLKFAVEPIRVVCQNTLHAGLASAIVQSKFRHVKGLRDNAQWHIDMIGKLDFALDKVVEAMRTLADAAITSEQAKAIIEASYPTPAKNDDVLLFDEISAFLAGVTPADLTEEHLARATEQVQYADAAKAYANALAKCETYRAGAAWCYDKLCDEYPRIAGTGWAVYNAIVECEDYREGSPNAITLATDVVFGGRARTKERAFRATMAMVKAK